MFITVRIGLKKPCMIRQKNIKLLEVWREEQSIKSSNQSMKVSHPRRYLREQCTRNDHGYEKFGNLPGFAIGWSVLDLLGRSVDERGEKSFKTR